MKILGLLTCWVLVYNICPKPQPECGYMVLSMAGFSHKVSHEDYVDLGFGVGC